VGRVCEDSPRRSDLPPWFLRVDVASILQSIAEDIDRPELAFEQQAKGKGDGTLGPITKFGEASIGPWQKQRRSTNGVRLDTAIDFVPCWVTTCGIHSIPFC
jgi:hypothetical protein